MYDTYKSYTGAFIIAGLPPMIFGILLTTTRFVRKRTMVSEEKGASEPKLLSPVSELHNAEIEGKHSIIVLNAEHPLLLSKTINPNYSR